MLIEQIQPATSQRRRAFRRMAPAIALAALSLPTLLFVWLNRDVPHFGVLQDDGMYLIDAKAIAQGVGYRILSLPAQPYDTRYPPLYPLLLSLAWRVIPSYPANLAMAVMLSWLCLPAVLLLAYWWCVRHRFPLPITWLTVGLFALNPYVLFFVSNLGSEMLFMVFLLAAMLVAERRGQTGWRGPLLAGLLAGAAYLTRTSGIALLPAAVAYYCWKKAVRQALWFTLGMLPAVAGWALWSRFHAAPGQDVVTLCYTNYLGYYFKNVGWDNIAHVISRNAGALLEAMGSLIFPQLTQGLLEKLLLWPLGVATIFGTVRMLKRGYGELYALFACISLGMLLVWHYEPNQRFILPMAPLLLAGFCFEMDHLAELFRRATGHRNLAPRAVARTLACYVVTLLTAGLVLQICMDVSVVPQLARNDRANARAYRGIYDWIDQNLPAGANILWQDDTALYLATGHHSASFVVPPRQFEATGGDKGEAARFRGIAAYAREQHMGYILVPKVGLRRNEGVLKVAAADPQLEAVHQETGGILYRVR